MALQVWLPLTKDLRQQGVSNVSVVNNGATYSSTGGKLGGCYSFDGTDDFLQLSNINLKGVSELSISFWCYSMATDQGIFLIRGSGAWRLYINTNRIRFRDNNNTGDLREISFGEIPLNTWTHLVYTYKNGEIWIYKNGIEVVHNTTYYHNNSVFLSDLDEYRIARTQSTSGNAYFNGKLNDFRIYNNCLSAEEVKRISQGLILHYPLSHMGLGQENLLKGTDILEITNNINTGVGGWDNISTLTTTDNGVKLTGRSGSPCIGLPLANTGSINNNEPYTLSFKYRTNKAMSCNFYYIESSGSNVSIYSDVATKVSTTEWQDFKWTITSSTVADRIPRAILMFYAFSSNSSDWVEIKRGSLKLEKGSIATPWSPAPNDTSYSQMGLDSNIEFDTSGFCNNAISNGSTALSYSSDAPKYSVSTVFASGARIATPVSASTFMPTDEITVSIWFKSSNAANRFISCTEGGGFNFESNSGNIRFVSYIAGQGYAYANSTTTWTSVSDNIWHMLTATNDRSTVKIYLDGILIQETACQYSGSTLGYASSTPFTLGAEAQTIAAPIAATYVGNLSDCRVYATALSADDVKSLYQNCATIGSNGVIYGQIRS